MSVELTQETKLWIVIACVIFANLLCVVRLTTISLSNREGGNSRQSAQDAFHKKRVNIVDRNDVILATNLTTFSMYADPKIIIEPDNTAKQLAAVLDNRITYDYIYKAITTPHKRFVWLKRNLVPKDFLKVNDLGNPGVFFLPEEKRVYPQANLVSHVIGHVDTDGRGISGIEGYFNDRLSAGTGAYNTQQLVLSIDIRIQHAVRSELYKQMEQSQATGGAAVVMSVKTGEILAIVSLPDFDPNNMNKVPSEALFNRATLGVYEIGSIFKTFTVAFALEEKAVTSDELFDVSAPLKMGHGHYIRDLYPIAGGMANLETIFKKSSNIGIAMIGLRLGEERIRKYLGLLGFDSAVSVELPEKSVPLHPKQWSDAEVATVSYGYGVAATVVHVAEAMATIVNEGRRVRATLLKKEMNDVDGLGSEEAVISPVTSQIVRKLLYKAVKEGTGRRASVPGYCVGGKTGTSDKIINGKYDKNRITGSFAAVFPLYDPQYVIVAMIDDPAPDDIAARNGVKVTGGLIVAPVVGKIITRLISLLHINPEPRRCAIYE